MVLTPRRHSSRGFTLVEVLTVIAIIGVLAAILIPVVGKARATARSSQCLANLRQIGAAFMLYANDHDQKLPAPEATDGTYWFAALQPYVGTTVNDGSPIYSQLNQVFQCPEWSLNNAAWGFAPPNIGYAMSAVLTGSFNKTKPVALVRVTTPSQTPLVIEGPNWTYPFFPQEGQNLTDLTSALLAPANETSGLGRHHGHANYLFVDGHVKGMTPETAERLLPDS